MEASVIRKPLFIGLVLALFCSWSGGWVIGSRERTAFPFQRSATLTSARRSPTPLPTIIPRDRAVPLPTGLVTLGPTEFALGRGQGWHVEDEGLVFTGPGEWLSPIFVSGERSRTIALEALTSPPSPNNWEREERSGKGGEGPEKYPFWGRLWPELDRPPNLIPNGDFETVEEGAPARWRVYDLPGATLEVAEGDAAGGQRSLRFTFAETDEGGYLIRLRDRQPLEPGFYALYARFRCSAGFAETGSVYGGFALYRQQDQAWDEVWNTSTYVRACAAGSPDTRTPISRWQMGWVALVYVPDDGHAYGFKAGLWFSQFLGRPTTGTLEVDEFRLEPLRPLWLSARSSLDGTTWTEWTPRYLLLQVGDHFLALPSLDGDEVWETVPRFAPRANLLLPLAQGYPYVQLRLTAEAPLILRALSFEHTPAIPFVIPWDDAEPAVVSDHPYAPQNDAPAGRHGFVVAHDGHLYFERTGERARFWGIQTHAGACFDDETNRLMIERMAKHGFNLIKVGGPGWYWWDEEKRDCYDRFFATMKAQGIYGYLQLEPVHIIYAMARWPEARAYITASYGTFPEWEWFISGSGWPWHGPGFRVAIFCGDEALTAFVENWFRDLLEHRNPYTGKRYLEEEAVALVEISNENWLTYSWYDGGLAYGTLPTYYEDLFDERWRAWLQERYGSFEALKAAWDDGTGQALAPGEMSFDSLRRYPDTPEDIRGLTYSDARSRDLALFYRDLERAYYEHMARFLKETLGVRQPVIASQTTTGRLFSETVVESSILLDVNDIHRYYDHPRRGNVPGLGRVRIWNKDPFHPTWGDAIFDVYGQFNLRGKPLTRSEVNWTWYNEHSCLFIPGLVAYSSLHDVDAVVLFCYMWHHDCDTPQQHEGWIFNGSCDPPGGAFRLHSNPIVLTQNVAAYVAFLRGDVASSPSAIPLRYTREGLEGMVPTYLTHWWSALLLENLRFADRHVGLVQAVEKDYEADTPSQESPWPDAPGGTYVSATGQITYSFGTRLFTVETPRFQAAAGQLAGRTVWLGKPSTGLRAGPSDGASGQGMEVIVHNPTYAAVMRTDLTPAGDRSLLSVAARTANFGMVLSPSGEEPLAWGERPVIAEVVRTTVRVPTPLLPHAGVGWESRPPRIYALDPQGRRAAQVPAAQEGEMWVFELGTAPNALTLWYEIENNPSATVPISPGTTVLDSERHFPDGVFRGTTLTSAGLTLGPADGGYVITGTWTSPVFQATETPVWGRLSWNLDTGYAEELTNGDFEADDDGDGLPDGWTADPDTGAYVTAALVDDGAYSGSRFFRLTMTGTPLAGNVYAFKQEISAAPGASYILAAHVRCSPDFARTATAAVHLTVRRNGSWYDSRTAYLRACYADTLNYRHGTDIWQPARPLVFTLPDDGATYTLQVSLLFKPFVTGIAPQGYVDFDGVRLLRLPPTRVALQVRTSQNGQTWSDWSPARYLHLLDSDTAFLLDLDFADEGLDLPNLDPRAWHFLPARHGYPYLQLRLTLSTDDPTRTPLVRSLHFDYGPGVPFLPPWDDATDSPVNLHPFHPRFDAPAGRHGFVHAQEGRLVFDDGTPARFWGAAYDMRYCWPKEQETIAARLAKFGFNLVKLTAVDGAWWSHGQDGCLDTFVAALRERGVYSYLQLASWAVITAMRGSDEARTFYTERYGTFPELQTFLDMGYDAGEKAWQLSLFAGDPDLTAFFQSYVTDVLTHVNPHTGLAYKDDPAIVLVELVNENYLTRRWASGTLHTVPLPSHYAALFDQGWHGWLRAHYASFEELKAAWDDGTGMGLLPGETDFDQVKRLPDRLGWPRPEISFSRSRIRVLARFYAERERAFYEEMAQFVHDLGVRVPVIASQHPTLLTEEWLALSSAVDAHDIHRYFDHPTGSGPAGKNVIRNLDPFLPVWAWHLFPYLGSTRLGNKPTSMSETNWALNNPCQYLLIPGLVGYASYAGIDSVAFHSYIHSGAPPQEPWEQTYLVPSVFRFHSNPLLLTATALASVAFRRGDVSPPATTTEVHYSSQGVRERFADHFYSGLPDLFLESGQVILKEATLMQGFRKRYAQPDPTQDLPDGAANAADDTYISDTGELAYSLGRRRFTLDTCFTQAVAGRLAGETVPLSDLTVQGIWPEYAGVMITSLTEAPLRETHSALLWAASRVVNTGMWANEENTVPQEWGGEPLLAEAVAVTVTLRTDMPFVRVYALDERGQRKLELPVQEVPGGVTFVLGSEYETLWYELVTGMKAYLPLVACCSSSRGDQS